MTALAQFSLSAPESTRAFWHRKFQETFGTRAPDCDSTPATSIESGTREPVSSETPATETKIEASNQDSVGTRNETPTLASGGEVNATPDLSIQNSDDSRNAEPSQIQIESPPERGRDTQSLSKPGSSLPSSQSLFLPQQSGSLPSELSENDLTPAQAKRCEIIATFRTFRKNSGGQFASDLLRKAMLLDQELETLETTL